MDAHTAVKPMEYNERLVPVELSGTIYYLNFSTRAVSIFLKKFGSVENVVKSASKASGSKSAAKNSGPKALEDEMDFDEIIEIIAILIQQGALYIKHEYHVDAPTLTAEELGIVSNIKEIPLMVEAMTKAIDMGSDQEIVAEPKNEKAGQKN